MNKVRFRQIFLLFLAGLVLIVTIIFIIFTGSKKNMTCTVGLIMTGETDDDGWNSAHYNGVISACEKLGTELIIKENVAEGSGECADAIHELVKEGAGMIILSSYSYSSETKDVIDSYPEISFYAISSEYYAKNITSYFGRMYQARYLAGIIAGLQTESNSIGYVAAMPNSEVNRGINAFTLGAKSVNPETTVHVYWTGTWDDEASETAAAEALINNKAADVLTYHQNQHYTAQTADKAGIYSIGYNEEAEGLSDKYLTAAVWNWDALYYQIIREYVQGQPNSVERRWFALDSGTISLSEFSPLVKDAALQAVEEAKNRLLKGEDVFSGEIYDNNGVLKCNRNETLMDEMLFENMNWLVEGVEIYNEEN